MSKATIKTDVALVGAGIMSATLGALIKQLQPDWTISLFERLDAAAAESRDTWNCSLMEIALSMFTSPSAVCGV